MILELKFPISTREINKFKQFGSTKFNKNEFETVESVRLEMKNF
jgi:hypothetical protein